MLRLITAPTGEPVEPTFVKTLLRIDDDAFDTVLPALISTAREVVERQTGYALADGVYAWEPVGPRTSPLPIRPAVVTSAAGARPIMFRVEPGVVPESLKLAITMLVGDFILKPEATTERIVAENPALKRILFSHSVVLP
ncbi:head-tail connector protein [Achromobacter denitrificans]|uniref:head-tail connector protein n=1 Tax=Achromobacter denitrificans TaxID=32002 RepID=UPI00242C99D9|nr:head-tail connector protein [Achromobacter denitrificans]MBV2160241.1 phage gp6-like head-tail connector protein [Achromobacter denitrificans]